MKLFCPKNKGKTKYVHIYKNIEQVGYSYKTFPQSVVPKLAPWQLAALTEYLQNDAKHYSLQLKICSKDG